MHTDRDYKIIAKKNITALEREVSHMMITHNWQPAGGISVCVEGDPASTTYCQAMISPRACGILTESTQRAIEALKGTTFGKVQAE